MFHCFEQSPANVRIARDFRFERYHDVSIQTRREMHDNRLVDGLKGELLIGRTPN